jgi:hypothetical protein
MYEFTPYYIAALPYLATKMMGDEATREQVAPR